MNTDQKITLITKNLQEVIGIEEMRDIIENRNLKIYWGTATTGKPHIAYLLPILKIRDFIKCGCEVKILLADIHAFLDNLKAPINLVDSRAKYYEKIIKVMLSSLEVDLSSITFIKGSTYQKSEDYIMDLYKLSTVITDHDAKKAGSQVVKQEKNPKVSSMIYPAMQALDEEYLGVDAQFGGVDQRKIFTFAMKYLPMIGYKKRIHLMNPIIEGLNSFKMSSSDMLSKIDLMEDSDLLKKKIAKCYCAEGDASSGIFQILNFIIFPILEIKKIKIQFKHQTGIVKEYFSFKELESDFCNKLIHPCDLKDAVFSMLDFIIQPIRDEMTLEEDLVRKAYG